MFRATMCPSSGELTVSVRKWYFSLCMGGSFVFQVAIQKFKDQDTQNYNFVCCPVWVWNLVADIAVGKEAEGVWEHGVEENIWT